MNGLEIVDTNAGGGEGGVVMSLTRDTLTYIEVMLPEALFERAVGQVPAKGWQR